LEIRWGNLGDVTKGDLRKRCSTEKRAFLAPRCFNKSSHTEGRWPRKDAFFKKEGRGECWEDVEKKKKK